MQQSDRTSWQGVKGWYNKIVGSEGHYYHEHVVIPGVLKLLKLKPGDSVVRAWHEWSGQILKRK